MEEIDPVDFIGLEAIRTFAPDMFEFIRESKEIFAPKTSMRSDTHTTENVKKLLEEQFSKLDPQIVRPVQQTLRHLGILLGGRFPVCILE